MSFKNNYRVRKWESERMATLGEASPSMLSECLAPYGTSLAVLTIVGVTYRRATGIYCYLAAQMFAAIRYFLS
jgi:hypothetical protein